jgi:outer membrane lipoprotein-sorting protein
MFLRQTAGRGGLALSLGAVLALASCASVPPAPVAVRPEAQAARELLERRWEEFRDLRSVAEITISRGKRVQRFSGALLLRAPSSLRFEALAPFGTPVLVVSGDAQTVTVWEVFDQRAYVLPASADANRRWLGLAIGTPELVALLSGRVMPLRDALEMELLEPDEIGPSLSLRSADTVQRIWLDPATGQPRQVQWTDGANPARVTFSGGRPDAPPAGLTAATLDGKLEVVVKYHDPQMNSGFDPDLMKLTIPERVRIQHLR